MKATVTNAYVLACSVAFCWSVWVLGWSLVEASLIALGCAALVASLVAEHTALKECAQQNPNTL